MSHAPAAPFRLTGRHVLAGVVAFFLVVIGVDVLFATLAYKTFSGQSANNPYEAGLLYNRTLAERRAEARLGWLAKITVTGGRLDLALSDADGRALDDIQIRASLTRPATETGRRTVILHPASDGHYVADIGGLSGAWDVSAQVFQASRQRLLVEQRVNLP